MTTCVLFFLFYALLQWAQNVNALLSIGGWSGGRCFSSSMATTQNRTIFAQTVISLCQYYDLDGVEIKFVSII
jgi:GH18 family chitinase